MGNEVTGARNRGRGPRTITTAGLRSASSSATASRAKLKTSGREIRYGDGSEAEGIQSDSDDEDVKATTFRDVYKLQGRIGEIDRNLSFVASHGRVSSIKIVPLDRIWGSGTGSHSQVFRAVERETGHEVAVKAIHTDWLDRKRLGFLRAEINIHREVSSHHCVVGLIGVYDDPEACFMVQELAYGGSLWELLHSRSVMGTEAEVRLLLWRLLTAAQFLHHRGIVHRDIKPENLLIMKEGEMDSVRLADFGFATRLSGFGRSAGGEPACGTPEYVAPEVLLQQPFCGKADVWSAGVTAFSLLSGQLPFHGLTLDTLYTAILDGACSYASAEWARVSVSAQDFVRCMLQVDPRDRWTASQLLEHPWMAGGGRGVFVAQIGSWRHGRARLKSAVFAIIFLNRLLVAVGRGTIGERCARQLLQELGSP